MFIGFTPPARCRQLIEKPSDEEITFGSVVNPSPDQWKSTLRLHVMLMGK
jgi:hypothetical protein